MQPFALVLTKVSAMAAGSLVAAVWEGLVLAAVVAGSLRLLPRITAAARSVVWLAVLAVVVLLPFLHVSGPGAGTGSAAGWKVDERVSLAIVAVWATLSVWRAVELVRSAVYLRGIARRAVEVEVSEGISALLQCATPPQTMKPFEMGHPNGCVGLCVSDEVDRPSVVGFLRPRVLIPVDLLERLSEEELAQIVMHEMEHLRRRDDWTNLAQKLALVVFPLNPVLVWVERRLCLERELACDDQVLRATNARKAYAACLANLAEHSLVRRGVSLALGAWERRPELVRRVHRILSRPSGEMGRRQVTAVVSVLMVGLVAGADGLAHVPELVSFGPKVVETAGAGGADIVLPTHRGEAAMNGALGGRAKAQDVMFRVPAPRSGVKPRVVSQTRSAMATWSDVSESRHRAPNAVLVSAGSRVLPGTVAVVQEVRTAQLAPDGMVVMVTWRTVAASNGGGDLARSAAPMERQQDVRFSYAAVPTRDGWLIVQL